MAETVRRIASVALALALGAPAGAAQVRAQAAPTEESRIVHALSRLTFGARPGDVGRVSAMGLERWIDLQLHPERIPDGGLDARLRGLRTLDLSSAEIMEGYDPPAEVKREVQRRRAEIGEDATDAERARLRREITRKYRGRMAGAPRQVVGELQQAKVLRAVYSERQLDEVLVDFWMNHFNVFAMKGADRFLVTAYERDVVRPRAWGRFEDLLVATAKSPAMLFYLDNWLSVSPEARLPRGRGRRTGLNENYAREVMELHTLGVDGGYTQQDVREVARALTGWSIRGLRQQRPEFVFQPAAHDRGDKTVLGRRIRGAGVEEGEEVLHLLATHPSTARFIAAKLARRFVADEPPAALVERAAATFRRTDGDIREVVRAIVTAPEFFDPRHHQVKVKTPLEFVVSAVRASGAEVTDARALAQRIGDMGMPLYQQQPPTGYKDTAEAWVSTSGLLARLNFALDLAGGRLPGTRVDASRLTPRALVPAGLSETTRRTLDKEAGPETDPARIAGLVLGSPEFQRR